MTCTLSLYADYLINSPRQTAATGLSRRLGGTVSHDQVTRWFSSSYPDPEQVRAPAKPLIRRAEQQRSGNKFAVFIVADSILKKAHTDPSALICTHCGRSQGRFVSGLSFGRLRYQTSALALPIAVELIKKTKAVGNPKTQKINARSNYTQNENLRTMLRVAQQPVAYRYLLTDRWYASAENLNAVLDWGYHFVMALESSRTAAQSEAEWVQGPFQAVDTPTFSDVQPLRVWLWFVAGGTGHPANLTKQRRLAGRAVSG